MSSLSRYKFAIGYIICVAFVSVIREKLMLEISPIVILFISSSLACLYFHLINVKESVTIYKKFNHEQVLFVKLNLAVAIMWMTTYYSIYYSSATVFVYEFFMVGGYLSLVYRDRKNSSQKLAAHFFMVLILAPFFIYKTQMLGILLGILSGVFGFIYNITSNNVALKLNLSASQVLASRFWFLVILSGICLPKYFLQTLTLSDFIVIIIITALSFILQIWLNQKSILSIGGKESSFMASFAPTLTFITQGIVLNHWFLPILLLSFLGSVYIMYESILSSYKKVSYFN